MPLARFLPAALLVVVALAQLYLAHRHDLPAWKGGGFGMFATVDRLEYRMVHAYLITRDGAIPVPLQELPGIDRLLQQSRATPHSSAPRRLARAIAQRRWQLARGAPGAGAPRVAVPITGVAIDADPVDVRSVRVEVWRPLFDSSRRLVRRHLLARHLVERRP